MLNIRDLKNIAEEIAPKIAATMDLPISLKDLEFEIEYEPKDYSGCYMPELNKIILNMHTVSKQSRIFNREKMIYFILAHELFHYAQFSNFPILRNDIHSIESLVNNAQLPKIAITQLLRLIEGDAVLCCREFQKFPLNITQHFYSGFGRLLYVPEDNDHHNFFNVYILGYYYLKKINSENGRNSINSLYELPLEEKLKFFSNESIKELIPKYSLPILLAKPISKLWDIEYEIEKKMQKSLSPKNIKDAISRKYWHAKISASPEFKEYRDLQRYVAKVMVETKNLK